MLRGMDAIVASAQETVAALLGRSKRRSQAAPLRRSLVQGGAQNAPVAGPLAELVRRHDLIAIRLYLLLVALATAAPYAVRLHSMVWARAVGLDSAPSGTTSVSRAWRRLEDAKLIKRERVKRRAEVTLLKEDGTGAEYHHPGELASSDAYLQLPFAYWLAPEAYFLSLSLAETAVLIIALSLPDDFVLPLTKAQSWYGISQSTIERGLSGLQDRDLLKVRFERRRAPLAPAGFVQQARYTLQLPFRPRRRAHANVRDGGIPDSAAPQATPTQDAAAYEAPVPTEVPAG